MNDIRQQFPFFMHNPTIIYFDNAATTQKPIRVVKALEEYLVKENANAGRGSYQLAATALQHIESVREIVKDFVHATTADEIVFTSGATESLNITAQSWGLHNLRDGDEILYCPDDHKACVQPWILLQEQLARQGVHIKLIPFSISKLGGANYDELLTKVTNRTKVIVLTHVHNVYGSDTNVQRIRSLVGKEIIISLDASQSVGHLDLNVQELSVDFLSFSGHKMFALPGSGVLWVHKRLHAQMQPTRGGGTTTTFVKRPLAFLEVGTQNIPAIISLGEACRFLQQVTFQSIAQHLTELTQYALFELRKLPRVHFLPGPHHWSCVCGFGILSFTIDGISSSDIGFILNLQNICVRTGSHCMHTNTEDSIRISMHIYNTKEEVDRFIAVLQGIVDANE